MIERNLVAKKEGLVGGHGLDYLGDDRGRSTLHSLHEFADTGKTGFLRKRKQPAFNQILLVGRQIETGIVLEKFAQIFVVGGCHGWPLEANWNGFGLTSDDAADANANPLGEAHRSQTRHPAAQIAAPPWQSKYRPNPLHHDRRRIRHCRQEGWREQAANLISRSGGLDVARGRIRPDLASSRIAWTIRWSLENLMGCGPGVSGGLLDTGDIRRDFSGTESRLLDVARDLLRRRTLFFDGAGNRGGDLVHFIDRGGDPLDRADSFAG